VHAPELLAPVEKAAEAEGISVQELTAQALRRELARRFLEQTRRDGLKRRGNMSDDEVDDAVDTAVHSWRREQCGR
jgi:hypothetical protein